MTSHTPELDCLIQEMYSGARLNSHSLKLQVERCFRAGAELDSHEAYKKHRMLKRVREEAYPISVFLAHPLAGCFEVSFSKSEHSNFDAYLFSEGVEAGYIEVTMAIDGELHFFRSLHMDKFGHAPLTGVTVSQLMQSHLSGVPCEAEAVEVKKFVVDVKAKKINEVLRAKLLKKYPDNTTLLIVLDDLNQGYAFDWIVQKVTVPEQNKFKAIYLVDTLSKICLKLA